MGGWAKNGGVWGGLSALVVSAGVTTAQTPSLTLLGLPAGRFNSYGTALSADGRTVVGYNEAVGGTRAWKWTRAGGFEEFGSNPGVPLGTRARGVSADGSFVVGERSDFSTGEAFRYSGGSYQNLGLPSGTTRSAALGVSGNAGVVVGVVQTSSAPSVPYRWTPTTGGQSFSLPRVGDIGGWFTGVSRDGSTAIGISGGSTAAQFDPFTWTQAGGWRQLPVPSTVGSAYDARPAASNLTGSLIVGFVSPASSSTLAVLWSGSQVLTLSSFGSEWGMYGGGVSDSGSIIVGTAINGSNRQPVVWLGANATPINFGTYLSSLGVSVPTGWRLTELGGVTPDGHTVWGYAQSGSTVQTFVATIPSMGTLAIGSVFSAILLRRQRIKPTKA